MSEREIPDSVMDAFLAAMGWANHAPRNRELAEAPIRAVIDAWEAHAADELQALTAELEETS